MVVRTFHPLRLAGALALALLAGTLGCGTPIGGGNQIDGQSLIGLKELEAPPQKPSRDLGKFVYQNHCANCHGTIGPKLTVPGYQLRPEEQAALDLRLEEARVAKTDLPNPFYPEKVGPYDDLYDFQWFDNQTDFGAKRNAQTGEIDRGMSPLIDYTYRELFDLISEEPHGGGEEAVDFRAKLSDRERWAAVYYVSNMALDNGKADWKPTWDQQLELRNRVYGTHCTICHGGVGRGDGPEGHELVPPPMNFNGLEWAVGVKHGYPVTDQYLYDIIANGKINPGSNTQWTGMPWWKDQLREEDIWGLIDFIRNFSYEKD